jgi:hypothetical protein
MSKSIGVLRTCCEVQHVSGLPSVKYFLPTDLSRVELTLARKYEPWCAQMRRWTHLSFVSSVIKDERTGVGREAMDAADVEFSIEYVDEGDLARMYSSGKEWVNGV